MAPSSLVAALALVALVLGGPPSQAQSTCGMVAEAGVSALREGQAAEAVRQLRTVVGDDPTCAVAGAGLAGDWLGRALAAQGDVEGALQAWETTLAALTEDTWARGGDALVGEYLTALVTAGRGGEARAALAFDLLLRPTAARASDAAAYDRLLAQVAQVLPADVAARAFPEGDWRNGVSAAGSETLAAWWFSEDPFPASAVNERVVEHLTRVGVALTDYADPSRVTGYDDRGALFVRFGRPVVARQLTFANPDLVFGMSRASVGISRSSFPPNEVWTYAAPGGALTYVLVGRDGSYRIGQTEDLLPNVLRTVTGQGRRQQALAGVALLAMRYIYGELATTAVEYGDAWVEADAAVEGTASPFANPSSAVGRIQRRLSLLEGEKARARDERAPPSASQVLQETPPVGYAADAARFLTDDGRTRLDLVWRLAEAPDLDAPVPLELVGTVVTNAGTDRQAIAAVRRQTLGVDQVAGREHVPALEASVVCRLPPCGPLLQLDLFAAGPDGAREPVGASVWELPPYEHLRPSGLEISDLRPIEAARAEPFVREAVPPGLPLSLYFEVYGFEGGAARSRVHIEYEVVRRRRGTLLRRTREVPSSGDIRLTVRGTRTEQYLILETSDWAGSDEVDVRVHVRDEQTGETVERVRTFAVDER